MRVLEIGTGYTAALLAHRLGAGNVTSIEIDPDLAARARAALATAGYGDVAVITGDGARGYSAGAPFDRVLSTVAAPRVPYPWVAQTRPGGLVVTPWSSAYEPAGLLSLTVDEDGTASGGPSTSSDHAGSGTRSPPPTSGENKPAGPASSSGGSPSPQTDNTWNCLKKRNQSPMERNVHNG